MSACLALLLPDEAWLQILGHLAYMDLRRARRICKRFYQLVQDPAFDLALFRAPPIEPADDEIKYKPHPLLERYELGEHTTREKALLFHWHRERIPTPGWPPKLKIKSYDIPYSNLYDFPVCDECATTPATTHLQILYDRHVLADIANEGGVTIRQILVAYADFWATPVEPYYELEYRRRHDLADDIYVGKASALAITFDGWRPLKVLGDTVRLEASMDWDNLAELLDRVRRKSSAKMTFPDILLTAPSHARSADSETEGEDFQAEE